jgi:glycosyltransferase involved in cell wall biosynthesis
VLIPVFERLHERHGDALHLDVYSSFAIYGQPERDRDVEELFARMDAHPAITSHGSVPNAVIRDALVRAHILAYPSVYRETSCIAAIEAMSAGCAVVATDLAALPETTAGFGFLTPFRTDHAALAADYEADLESVIARIGTAGLQERLVAQKRHADAAYTWEQRIPEWVALLDEVRAGAAR